MILHKKIFIPLGLVTLLAAVSGYYLYTKYGLHSALDIPGVRYFEQGVDLEPFRLINQNGASFNEASLEGSWSIVFFGYTHCPDICPTAMQNLQNIYKDLQNRNKADRVQVVFVSVDPQRDSQAALKEFINYFHADFMAVTGAQNEINILADRVGAIYDFEDRTSGDPITDISLLKDSPGYLVNHYSSFIVFNPDGKMIAHIYPPHYTERVVNILDSIMSR